jgi:hypothetical protein
MRWCDKRILARLQQEREYFEERIEAMNAALAESQRDCVEMIDAVLVAVDDVLHKASVKGTAELGVALQQITDVMHEIQRAILAAISNRVGEHNKLIDEPQIARH